MLERCSLPKPPIPTIRCTVLLLLLLLTLLLSGCAGGPPRQTGDICAVFSEKSGWQRVALRLQKKWQIPMHIPLAIMAQESAFRATAQPPRRYHFGILPGKPASSAFGYAQAINGTWNSYRRDTGEPWRRRDKFADALDFINWYITRTTKTNGVSRTDTYRQYLNYHEGWQGYKRGSFKSKSWLLDTAGRVAARADRYASQYRACTAGG